jgi:DNA-binding transcriptional regulator YdaS (Cro superfamily)
MILFPVNTPIAYLDKTKLFISFVERHKAIARWLRSILEQAGIDSSIFEAHSTHGAASISTATRGGVTTEDILKAAIWSLDSRGTITRK